MPILTPAIFLALPTGGIVAFLPMILIFVIFYMLIMMPQQKRQKKLQAMISSLKNGDRVMTSGGIRGTVVSVKDDAIQLRVAPDNLRIEIARGAVVSMLDESNS
ncbi:MAG: preprotein translocase subunit YajC [Acidobacteriaceae bacterium]